MGMTITPTRQALGAVVEGLDLSDGVSEDVAERLHQAWMENLVLSFPGLGLDEATHIALGSAFGRLAATSDGDDDYRGQETTARVAPGHHLRRRRVTPQPPVVQRRRGESECEAQVSAEL